jgi:hypothetical protein
MSIRFPDDLLLPPSEAPAKTPVLPTRMLAFVPIVVALAGVGAILIGSLTVRGGASAVTQAEKPDPITTGSVAPSPPKNIEQILEMLDK